MVYLHQNNAATDALHFDVLKEKLHGEIIRQVGVYRYGLMGTRSVFAASSYVDRDEFQQLTESRELSKEFPAATGIGYIHRVPVGGLDDFLQKTQAEGAPHFQVRMLAPQIEHDDLLIIKYIEPAQANHAAIGLDIGQEQRRRTAAEHAMRSGDMAITAHITLVQATGEGPGFLVLLPFYQPNQPTDTPQQREAALEGWVYMTLLAERLFAGTSDPTDGELSFQVFDKDELSGNKLIYDDNPSLTHKIGITPDATFNDKPLHDVMPVLLGGRHWMVTMHSTPQFQHASHKGMWMTGLGGCVLTALLVLLLQTQASSLSKAQELARTMTTDLRQAALTDRLTGLPNRAAIMEHIQNAIHRAKRVRNYHYAVLFLDFDRFKIINDSLGHGAGDLLLQEISRRLSSTLRSNDHAQNISPQHTAARLGGDEFVVLLDGMTQPGDARIVAQRLLDVLSKRYQLNNHDVGSTASIGVVTGDPGYESSDEVIRDADTAMYEAKNAGRGTYMVFDDAMRIRVNDRLNIENDLHHALKQQQLFLVYQPILSLHNGHVESFEALVRWQHPTHGLIGPDRFIPIAEETGLIIPLGQWVLNHAIEQFAHWQAHRLIPASCCISVNLSRKQLVLPELCDVVTQTLHRHGVSANRLHLEVTESGIMQAPQTATANLTQLRRVGVKINIDDFGTGHSSLACLHEFPIDILKVDRAFIANLDQNTSRLAVLRTVTKLARDMGVKVVAEGIETQAQLKLLRPLSCEFGQGYLFSKPLPAANVPAFCTQDPRDHLCPAA